MAKFVRLALLIALLILCLLGLNYSAQAQGVRFSPTAAQTTSTVAGQTVITPLPGASITVCAYPAVGQSSITPCSNTITTYTDQTLTSTCATNAQLVLDGTSSCVAAADAQGNFGWWAPLGEYSYSVCSNTSPASCATYWTDGYAGGVGPFSVTNTGTYTNTQMNLYFQSLLNGCSPLAEFQLAQTASNYSTDAGTFCIKVLGTSTVYEANALTAYAENNSTATNAVALYPSAVVKVNNGKAWPINPIAIVADGVTGATIQNELDFNIGTGSTGAIVYGINLSGIWNATPTTSFGVNLGPPGGTAAAKWQSGFITQPGAAISAFTAGPSCPIASLTCAASPIVLQSYNSSILQTGSFGFDTSGNITVAPKSGANLTILNGALILPNGGLVADNNTGGIQITPAAGKNVYLAVGVFGDASGFKHKRVAGCATAASLAAVCPTTVTWGTTFADANYTVNCTGDLITSGVPLNGGLTAKSGSAITFQTVAGTAAAAQYTTIDCSATHD